MEKFNSKVKKKVVEKIKCEVCGKLRSWEGMKLLDTCVCLDNTTIKFKTKRHRTRLSNMKLIRRRKK